MSVQITPDQQAKAEKLLSNLEYHGFRREFHEPNVIKAVAEGKETFSLKDSSFSKQVKFEVVVSTNSKGNFKHEVRVTRLSCPTKMLSSQRAAWKAF